ncbi:hypothetical protein AaE_008924 [Aphanomyces astaci]|uniref:Tc1-like transposase DDE domain-containing protein n=1 Tax=Aphanomyces astaci TaxID=112090 RepID=A0A6A5A6A6_APHAT|nr:hypothetical protein AaE_008924 [Aphanomyces astaci]
MRSLAAQSGVPKTTIIRHMKNDKTLKAKSNYSKPYLTDANAVHRMQYAMAFLHPSPNRFIFDSMYQTVHVDEKWFFLTTAKKRVYVYADEEVALRALKSKRFITKVMFLAAVARPRFDHNKGSMFSGKIGVWPFVEQVVAQRNSRNRPKGTVLLVPQAVTAEVYRTMILDKVVPAIQAKMPQRVQGSLIYLQQDNASPHKCVTTQLLLKHGVSGIEVANQPPNSPDFNVLDLGYFNSIQSLQHQKCTRTIEELISAVGSSFDELPHDILSKTFITLQKVMELSLENMGRNDYKLPHMRKDATIKDLSLFNVHCDPRIHEQAVSHLKSLE